MLQSDTPQQKQGTFSILGTLMLQHEKTAKEYRDILVQIEERQMIEWVSDLVRHHEEKADQIKTWLEEMPDTPVKLSEQAKNQLANKGAALFNAAQSGNKLKLARLVHECEEAVYAEYGRSLQNGRLPADIKQELTRNHKEMMEWVRKAQRMATVPK